MDCAVDSAETDSRCEGDVAGPLDPKASRPLRGVVQPVARDISSDVQVVDGDIGHSRRLSISAESTAQSTVFYTPFNDSIQRQSPYGLLGARIEYGPGNRRWAVGAYVRNLTNTDYVTATFGTPPNAFAGRPGPSRQFAVEFAVRR